MSDTSPKYTLWQAMHAALSLSLRAIEEVRALSRQPGPQGEPGKEGPAGKLPLVKEWTEGVHYEGAVVFRRGSTYQARRDTGREPPHDDWAPLALRGMDGGAPEVRSTFDPQETYRKLDIVAFNGGSFIAKRDDPGPCPGDGWQLLTSPGKRGERGPPGEPGSRGPEGKQGPAGPAVVAWKDDVQRYMATPIMSDGTEGPSLNIRVYLEQFLNETGR